MGSQLKETELEGMGEAECLPQIACTLGAGLAARGSRAIGRYGRYRWVSASAPILLLLLFFVVFRGCSVSSTAGVVLVLEGASLRLRVGAACLNRQPQGRISAASGRTAGSDDRLWVEVPALRNAAYVLEDGTNVPVNTGLAAYLHLAVGSLAV